MSLLLGIGLGVAGLWLLGGIVGTVIASRPGGGSGSIGVFMLAWGWPVLVPLWTKKVSGRAPRTAW